ncbi:hypothetical protein ACB092_03G013300 [Castanea dentata]
MSIGRSQSHDLSLGVRDPQDAVNGSYYIAVDKVDCDSTRPPAEDVYLAKNNRLKERDTGLKLRPYPLSLISAKSITTLNLLLSLMLHKVLMNFFSTPNHDSSNNSINDYGGVELRCEEEEDILILCLEPRWLRALFCLYFNS